MQKLKVIEVKGIRVLTSKQIAESYETTTGTIKTNFSRNRDRFIEGKHYLSFSGDELKAFKNEVTNCNLVGNRTSHLYLWTEKGTLLHAKSLNTDKAWEVYDYLVDFYFRAKEKQAEPSGEKKEVVPVVTRTEPLKDELPCGEAEDRVVEIKNPLKTLKKLLDFAGANCVAVESRPFKTYYSRLNNGTVYIASKATVERACYELAFELSHYFIHYNAGNMIRSPLEGEYNAQAHRAARMILKIVEA